MKSPDHWKLLRSSDESKVRRGLGLVEKAHAQQPDPSHIMELGVAYLWVRHYGSAWEHFDLAIKEDRAGTDCYYGMAGASKWCVGEFDEAVRLWAAGTKAAFQDTAGLGITLPLLLFFASVKEPATFERQAAEKLLMGKTTDSRIRIWPGPIASWMLGQISEVEFRGRRDGEDEAGILDRRWLAEFYAGVLQHGEGKFCEFSKTMQKLGDTSQPEWSDDTFFLARMWSEEFFLARSAIESKSLRG